MTVDGEGNLVLVDPSGTERVPVVIAVVAAAAAVAGLVFWRRKRQ